MRREYWHRFLRSDASAAPAGGGGSAGSTTATTSTTTETRERPISGRLDDDDDGDGSAARPISRRDADDYVDQRVNEFGSLRGAVRGMGTENYRYRERHRADTETIRQLRAHPAFQQGAVVLTGDDATRWPQIKKLLDERQLDPAKLQAALDELATARTRNADAESKTLLARIATSEGYGEGADQIFATLQKATGWHFETRDMPTPSADGKSVVNKPVAYVRTKKDGPLELLGDVLKREPEAKVILPALDATKKAGGGSAGSGGSSSGNGAAFIPQNRGTESGRPAGGAQSGSDAIADAGKRVIGSAFVSPSQRNKKAAES